MNPPPELDSAPQTGKWSFVVKTRWYQRKLVWAAIPVLLLGGYIGLPIAKHRFDRWNEQARLKRAAEYFEKGDVKRALLDARAILDSNPGSVEANRLIARTLEASGSPAALGWRIRLDSLVPGDTENLLGLAKDALDAGDIAKARAAFERLKPGETSSAAFHVVSARLAMLRGDTQTAETHLLEASALDPKDYRPQMILAILRLRSKKAEVRDPAYAVLRELATKPGSSAPALRALLADAQQFQHPARIKEFADQLAAAPGATVADKLSRLAVLRELTPLESSSYLGELQKSVETNPAEVSQLLMWMNQNDLATLASEWMPTLRPEIAAQPQVRLAMAHTYAKSAQWESLRQLAESTTWEELDYIRRAFLARALERIGEPEKAAAEWVTAISAAQGVADSPARLEQLAKMAQSWRWDQRAEEIFWLLTKTGRCPRWVLDSLFAMTLERGESAHMQAVAGLIAKAEPGGVMARNHYTFLSLLTRTEEGDPHGAAKALYGEHPEDPAVAVTYALSLYQQGKAREAVAVTSEASPGDLRRPGAVLPFYHGVFLIASDRVGEAGEFLQIAGTRTLLPEEKAILLREKAAAKKRAEDRAEAERARQADEAQGKRRQP